MGIRFGQWFDTIPEELYRPGCAAEVYCVGCDTFMSLVAWEANYARCQEYTSRELAMLKPSDGDSYDDAQAANEENDHGA